MGWRYKPVVCIYLLLESLVNRTNRIGNRKNRDSKMNPRFSTRSRNGSSSTDSAFSGTFFTFFKKIKMGRESAHLLHIIWGSPLHYFNLNPSVHASCFNFHFSHSRLKLTFATKGLDSQKTSKSDLIC